MKNPFANLFKKKDASAPPKVGESEKKKKGSFFIISKEPKVRKIPYQLQK